MTESEAIIRFEFIRCALLGGTKPHIMPNEENIGLVNAAIQALEKQIPKKPTSIDYEKYIDVINNAKSLRGAYWCPNCKRVVKSGSFCSNCGQKLDWSDEE